MSFEVILIAILMFFLLVGVHEWGHFYFARRVGILAREFAIGFGPKLFSYKRKETQYTFRMLPLGGYVRMAGEDPELIQISKGQTIAVKMTEGKVTHLYLDRLDERTNVIRGTVQSIDLEHKLEIELEMDDDIQKFPVHPQASMISRGKETQIAPWDRQFGSKTAAQKALVIFAGPAMNFILAFILFFVFVMSSGLPVENPTHIMIGNVVNGSPAAKAGLQNKDIVQEVDGEPIGTNSSRLIELIEASPEEEMNWVVIRDDQRISLVVTPEINEENKGRVGITIHPPTRTPGFVEGMKGAVTTMVDATKQILHALKMLVTFQLSMDDLGGPVRIAETTGEAYSLGVNMLIFWVAILSLYLGIFNLLPFPALDGSRILFFGIEAIRGKPIDPNRESMVHFIGFAMLMLLMIAVTYNDILRLFKG